MRTSTRQAEASRTARRDAYFETPFGPGRLTLAGDLPLELELPGPGIEPPVGGAGTGAGAAARWVAGLEAYFAGEPVTFDLDVAAHCRARGLTAFETAVYAALAAVPYGRAVSYRDLAHAAGRPNAYRAVGTAMSRNALPVILPCHRVIKNDGTPGPVRRRPPVEAAPARAGGRPGARRHQGRSRGEGERLMADALQFVIITGLSGAGKSQAIDSFEDAGYFCVDNLPPQLVPTLVDLFRREGSKVDRVAIVSDVRGGEYFGRLEQLLEELHERGVEHTVVFLEASNEALVRRFKETRRRHPAADGGSVIDGIRRERRLLAPLRERATLVLDTSDISIHELKARLNKDIIQHSRRTNIVFAVVSFGYKYGIPIDADLLFDVRFLPNPHYDLRLRPLTGLDVEVRDFVLESPDTAEYLDHLLGLLDFLFPRYAAEGKAHLTIGVGCTGGRHRSVAIAQLIGERYEKQGYYTNVRHRDMARDT